jgi:prepilin-type N-terminal cleavage/methylation domain-containing protein/prepilin-type processing-associated H-X9-DG protein
MGALPEKNEKRQDDAVDSHRPAHRSLPIINHTSSTIHDDGFTLIELLVVIAIVALLMAILLPTLSRVKKHAKAMICQSRLREWGMALAMYTDANQGRFPATVSGIDGLWLLRGAFISDKAPNGPQDSFHHFHTKEIACCPMATRPLGNGRFSATGGGNAFGLSNSYKIQGTIGSVFGAWEIATPTPAFRGSYGFNQWLFKGFHQFFSDVPVLRGGRLDLDILSLRKREHIPVLLDAVAPWASPVSDMEQPPPNSEGLSLVGIQNFCMDRHTGHVNALFLDWSVRKVGLKELWTLNWYTEWNRSGPWTRAGGVRPEQWPEWMRGLKDY